MKWSLFFLFVFVFGVQSRPQGEKHHHATRGPEMQCLTEENVDLRTMMRDVHVVSDVNKEDVGRYLACIWKKRQIINSNNRVSGENIFRYLKDVYYTTILSESNENEMRDASDDCAKVEDNNEGVLAIKVKNCIIEAVGKMPFLAKPKPRP